MQLMKEVKMVIYLFVHIAAHNLANGGANPTDPNAGFVWRRAVSFGGQVEEPFFSEAFLELCSARPKLRETVAAWGKWEDAANEDRSERRLNGRGGSLEFVTFLNQVRCPI